MQKIKCGDEVIVLTGRSKDQTGKVLKVVNNGERVLVEGVNLVHKHTRPNPQLDEQGGILEREAPIHISNVAIYNQSTGKADKVKIKVLEDGRKVRAFKSNDEVIDI